jgi:hypothetical protein
MPLMQCASSREPGSDVNNLELAQILSTINLVIVAEEFFGITDYRFKTPALYSLFEYPHPNHGCFSKALVYRFLASVTYEAALKTGVAHLHTPRGEMCGNRQPGRDTWKSDSRRHQLE